MYMTYAYMQYDRGQELAYLQMKDRELSAQKTSLERTTQGLMQQKEQLLQHYKETESVGKKLETYKEKLRVDAQVGSSSSSETLVDPYDTRRCYGVATSSRLLKIIGLYCRIQSLL